MRDGKLISSRLTLSDCFTCTGADKTLLTWLYQYIDGVAPPLPLVYGTPFQQNVVEKMKAIPFGQTVTYGELAALSERPGAARAVGGVCRQNPYILFVPCHRVKAANGNLGGFSCGLEMKRRLLAFEGSA